MVVCVGAGVGGVARGGGGGRYRWMGCEGWSLVRGVVW